MKIVLDATPVGVRTSDKGGVYRYINQLIAALAEVETPHRFRLLFNFCRDDHQDEFERARKAFEALQFEVVRARIPRALWLSGWVPAEFAAGACDVFHGLYDYVPPAIRGATVLTIHDLRYVSIDGTADAEVMSMIQGSPQLLADYQQRLDFFRRQRALIVNTARRARLIITPSEFSRQSIVDALGVADEKVQVVQHGISEDLRLPLAAAQIDDVLSRHSIIGPYLLYVGKMDPLKNVETLLRAFSTIRMQEQLRLVLVGSSGWYGEVLRQRVAELGIGADVTFLGHVTDTELKALYQGARIMVFPSLFEGFGLPVLEAMASGTPVVCSDHCSLPEVAGDAAMLVNPTSAEAIAAAVLELLNDSELYQRLRNAGLQRCRQFTWSRSACETVQAYERAGGC